MVAKEVKLSGNTLPIREFQLSWMTGNPSVCMVAKRGSGKSWVCRAIIKHFSNLPGGIIIAPTDKMNSFYGRFFPDTYIHYNYSTDILDSILYRQHIMIEKCKTKAQQGKKVDPRAFLLMDDCLSSKGSWMNDQPIAEIFYNGRHYQLMFILTMQFPLGIKPEFRSNMDYVFLLAEDFYSNQKRLYDHYAGMFPSLDSFRQILIQVTADFGAMVIVNKGNRKDFLDKVFFYRAPNERVDKIGCSQFRKFHEDNYDPTWQTRGLKFDPEKFANAKKQRIVVEKIEKNDDESEKKEKYKYKKNH